MATGDRRQATSEVLAFAGGKRRRADLLYTKFQCLRFGTNGRKLTQRLDLRIRGLYHWFEKLFSQSEEG